MDSVKSEFTTLENQHVELKSAFSWNSRLRHEDGDLRLGTARTIAAFANTSGGRLFIGVGDDGAVHGIEEEVTSLFGDSHLDQFEGLILEHLKNVLWPNPTRAYAVRFEQRESKWICAINVTPCPGVTYVRTKSGGGSVEHTVYVRSGNRTVKVADIDRDRMVVERFGGKWSI